ncbi:MAG: hypothetical protein LBU62_11695 [Bacteroidales bacterium]|jgi:hypothetical protein|nr:hypothetical protein [Bacteroidales bacterium]
MNTPVVDQIFDEIALLPDNERDILFQKIHHVFYRSNEDAIVAYTAMGEPLTQEQYKQRIANGITQCKSGQCTTLEQLSADLGYCYADL